MPDWKTVIGWRDTLRKAKTHADVRWYGQLYFLERESLLRLVAEQGSDPKTLALRQLEMVRQSLEASG